MPAFCFSSPSWRRDDGGQQSAVDLGGPLAQTRRMAGAGDGQSATESAAPCALTLEGVFLWSLEARHDARGMLMECWSDRWPQRLQPRQWAAVQSHAGALRGMHLHRRHDEAIVVLSGRCAVGLHDLRSDSNSHGRSLLLELDGSTPQCLQFPPGIVHGWLALSDCLHLQAVSEPHAEYADDDNPGCRWDDPGLGLRWPRAPTLCSARSAGFGSLAQLQAWWRSESSTTG